MKLNFKRPYISFIIARKGLECKINLYKIMGCRSSHVVRFDLCPLVQGQIMKINFKKPISHLLLLVEVCHVQTTPRKPWAADPVMRLDLTFDLCFNVRC